MHVTRRREDFNAITFELFRRKGISVKFKTKLYSENTQQQTEEYFHKEYVYSKGKKRSATITLSPKSYIQIDLTNYDAGRKELFFMSEAMKNKFIRKCSKLITILEAYDDHEIDIISVDSSGTHINSKVPGHTKVIMGRSEIDILLCIREDTSDVGVVLTFDQLQPIIISMHDAMELYHTLKDLNFTACTLGIISYLGSTELGSHETDFRQPGILDDQNREPMDIPNKYNSNTMSAFSDIRNPQILTSNNKINW